VRNRTRYKGAILFETVAFACCVVLMPTEKAQLISSASVTAFFLAASVWTRPYVENIEDWLDIAGRIFLLATLGVGLALMGDDSGGQVVCDVILAVIVLASNALFVFVLNPRKLLRGVVKAVRETRAAAHAAGWNEDAIKKMSSKELAEITADDVKGCSSLQVWWLLQYHLESDSSLPADVFSLVTELNLKDAKLSGKSHTFLPLSDRHNRQDPC
jgi:hypothetical protein